MEIPQVEAFLAVGTFGGFRRAADALRITQPAVSARIRALEDSLNVRLFERGKHGLALSAAGRALRPHAEQLLRAVALARQAVHDLRPASGGALQIAAVLSICTYLLPDVLKRFQAAYPKVLITVRSGHSKEVLAMVLGAEAEIGPAGSLPHPARGRELRRRTLAAIEIVDAEPISRSLDVIHPRARPLSGEARALLGVLRSALAQTGGRVNVRRRARAGAGRA